MKTMTKTVAVVLCAVSGLLPAVRAEGAVVTNVWQAVGGSLDGQWNDAAHWSLGRIPQSGDLVLFDTESATNLTVEVSGDCAAGRLFVGASGKSREMGLTFSGSGKVTFSKPVEGHCICPCRQVCLNGPTFVFTESGDADLVNCNAPLRIAGGSVWQSASYFQCSRAGELTVDDGVFSVTSLLFNNDAVSRVTVNGGGRLVCGVNFKALAAAKTKTEPFGLIINGGDVKLAQLDLSTRLCDYVKMEGGSLRVTGTPLYASEAQLDVARGAVLFGTAPDVTQGAADANYVGLTNRPPTVCGCRIFKGTDGTRFRHAGTFYVSQFSNQNASAALRIDCDRLVFDGARQPFAWTSTRVAHLYGPVEIFKDGSGVLDGSQNCYKYCHGRVTVNTRDFSSPMTTHVIGLRGIVSADGSLDLRVTGGGTFALCQAYSYNTCRSVTVEEGTTLQIYQRNGGIENYGKTTEWGPLATEALVLGKNVKVTLTAGANFICASKWTVDPSVTFTVTVPTLPASSQICAFPVLQDLDSKPLSDALVGQIALAGDTTGWTLRNEYGQISVCRSPDSSWGGQYSKTGSGIYEWKGAGANSNWSTVANWYDSPTLAEKKTHVFGASAGGYSYFDTVGGTTVGSVCFQTNVAGSCFVAGGNQMTLNSTDAIVSYSSQPQILASGLRVYSGTRNVRAYHPGPIVFSATNVSGKTARIWQAGKNLSVTVKFAGDVRAGCKTDTAAATSNISILPLEKCEAYPGYRTCLTVLDSGDLRFPCQSAAFAVADAAFRVSAGGTLGFPAASGASYSWTAQPAKFIVNGTLNIGSSFLGGVRQVYGGGGTLNLAGTVSPSAASSAVLFDDDLTVKISADWPTAVSANGYALALGATGGSPTLSVPDGWVYGPASGVTPVPSATARAFALENGACAVIDPNGGTATFNEIVSGFGTLVASNGTIVITCACEDGEFSLAARSGATLDLRAAQDIRSLDLASGSTLLMDPANALVLEGDAQIGGATIDVGTAASPSWQTLILSRRGSVVGTPVVRDGYRTRVVETANGLALQGKSVAGAVLLVR